MSDAVVGFVILLIILAGYWSLAVFPKQRDYKKHLAYVESLKVGDEVITYGGIIGTITELDEEVGIARIRIADGLEVKIIAAALTQPYDPAEIARNIQMAKQGTSNPPQ
jgi:preprotein translocase subunit YajC